MGINMQFSGGEESVGNGRLYIVCMFLWYTKDTKLIWHYKYSGHFIFRGAVSVNLEEFYPIGDSLSARIIYTKALAGLNAANSAYEGAFEEVMERERANS
jgi:hypothetical protein